MVIGSFFGLYFNSGSDKYEKDLADCKNKTLHLEKLVGYYKETSKNTSLEFTKCKDNLTKCLNSLNLTEGKLDECKKNKINISISENNIIYTGIILSIGLLLGFFIKPILKFKCKKK